uniref:Sushi, nidogen and EGF-like domain-containing protein 1 n=1 Tax=Plectus sambesii TaxID=2011161 RepID=A0A914V6F4_9BILA
MCLKAHVLLFILSWPMCAAKVPIGEFFPFGVENGDAVMERSDDGSSPRLPLSIAFPFFDFLHDALWVNVNGAISFVAAISTYTPACKAVTSDHRMIEPFWGDIDIRFTGDIFYRESFDTSVLRKAISEVASAFPDSQNVQLKWVYVITWFNVTFYPGTYNPRNTFQVALTTDGIQSFAIFYYNNITWTTGTSTGGNTSGLGGTPAQAGFDAGDGKTLFMIPGSCMDDIITIGDRSNVDSPGKWLFRVDNSNIQSAGCSTNFTGTFRVAPSFVDTNGHVDIEVSGPCVEEAENATCRFYDPNGNVTDVLAAKLGNQTSMTLLCATPFFYSIGRLRLDLIITHNDSTIKNIFNGYLYVVMPPETDGLLQFDIQPSQNDSDSFELTFTWNPESIGRDINFVDINMFIMKADTKIWQQGLQIAKKVVNNGIFKAVFSDAVLMDLTCGITPIELGVKAAFSVGGGIYDVIANPEHREHLIFTAGTVAVDFLSSVCGPPVRAAACLAWFALDPGPPKNLIPCPPNSTWARADPRFQLDYGCGVVPKPCNYHEGADYCIDSIEPSADGGMQQCCYKDDKILLGPPGTTLQKIFL